VGNLFNKKYKDFLRELNMIYIKQIVFLFLFILCFFLHPFNCEAEEINVELVWQFPNPSWLEVEIRQGVYDLFFNNDVKLSLKKDERFIIGQSSLVSFLTKDGKLWIIDKPNIIMKTFDDGVFRVREPQKGWLSYRGNLTFVKIKGCWKLINSLDQEEYLKGVVPIEMGNAWAEQGFEALKAQAVAARTYLIKNMGPNKTITDSPNIHQAYLGKTVEGEASKAVEATNGEILVDIYTKEPISVFYSSHNGGYSEETQNVWLNHDPHYTSEPDPFTAGTGGFIAKWRYIIAADTLGQSFDLAPIRSIDLKKYKSGRVYEVMLTDWLNNQKSVSGGDFVQKFYPYNRPLSERSFLGRLFSVDYIVPKDSKSEYNMPFNANEIIYKNVNTYGPVIMLFKNSDGDLANRPKNFGVYVFNGRGWGHGVGMSQWGAYNMAKQGYSYEQILYYYYKNSVIAKR